MILALLSWPLNLSSSSINLWLVRGLSSLPQKNEFRENLENEEELLHNVCTSRRIVTLANCKVSGKEGARRLEEGEKKEKEEIGGILSVAGNGNFDEKRDLSVWLEQQ